MKHVLDKHAGPDLPPQSNNQPIRSVRSVKQHLVPTPVFNAPSSIVQPKRTLFKDTPKHVRFANRLVTGIQ